MKTSEVKEFSQISSETQRNRTYKDKITGKLNIMDQTNLNTPHPTNILERQKMVDGVIMREGIDVTNILNDEETGVERIYLTTTRAIGERKYTKKQPLILRNILGGDWIHGGEAIIETDMNDSDLENFKNEWEEKWNAPFETLSLCPEGAENMPLGSQVPDLSLINFFICNFLF